MELKLEFGTHTTRYVKKRPDNHALSVDFFKEKGTVVAIYKKNTEYISGIMEP